MNDAVGGFLFGFGAVGLFYALLFWAAFKTLTASIVEMRNEVFNARAVVQDLKSETRRKRRDGDEWKNEYLNEDEEEGDDWN